MLGTRSLCLVAAVAVVFASTAYADKTITGSVGGVMYVYDEDVYFVGDVYLFEHLYLYVYNGSIYTSGCNFIDGSGTNGSAGLSGYYESEYNEVEDKWEWVNHPPQWGGRGENGFGLRLHTYGTGDIHLETPMYLNGGHGGNGGHGQNGLVTGIGQDCEELPPVAGAPGGGGGWGGSLVVYAVGDVYWEGDLYVGGGFAGLGGNAGDGGGGQFSISSSPTGGAAGGGGIGGDSGDVSVNAGGDIILTSSLHIDAIGGEGGDGGGGADDCATNTAGGGGGLGGDGGFVSLYAANIGPDAGDGYGVTILANSGVGGSGGPGGAGSYDYCTALAGCFPPGPLSRGPGKTGGSAGSTGDAGVIWAETSSSSGNISLRWLQADAHPAGQNGSAGPAGFAGFTKDEEVAECADCDEYWGVFAPPAGQLGRLGGEGGIIYFECDVLDIRSCDLDVRGGKGGNGGDAGDGECASYPICQGATGGSGGQGGLGGLGGTITYYVNTIYGSGGVARRCSGAGGKGGDGGFPNGSGGAGNSNGSPGTINNYASYGTPPTKVPVACANSWPVAGASGDDCN